MVTASLQQLHEEHTRHIVAAKEFMQAFARSSTDENALRIRLRVLCDGFQKHLQAEESDGLFTLLRLELPARAPLIDTLIDEHTLMMLYIANFKLASEHPERYSASERIEMAKDFTRLFEAHATLERDLLAEALGLPFDPQRSQTR